MYHIYHDPQPLSSSPQFYFNNDVCLTILNYQTAWHDSPALNRPFDLMADPDIWLLVVHSLCLFLINPRSTSRTHSLYPESTYADSTHPGDLNPHANTNL